MTNNVLGEFMREVTKKVHYGCYLSLTVLLLAACGDNDQQLLNEVDETVEVELSDAHSEYPASEMLFETLTFEVKEGEDSRGTFKVDLINMYVESELTNDIQVDILEYFPDFYMNGDIPDSKTSSPLNPAFIINIIDPSFEERLFAGIGKVIHMNEDEYAYSVELIDTDVSFDEGRDSSK
ncbi:hypothetical protein [Bacillus alkalicellulosilyticus]|uniref:hypothetical protein n=1 Tax=Alkalihalobacterium alkalicellulosilyticum TaxID=1912214 RepID=UPI000998A3FA|nr:hypothetical protein [Bacillus alkalicellulosilyticus]